MATATMTGYTQRSIRLTTDRRDRLEKLGRDTNLSTQKLIETAIDELLDKSLELQKQEDPELSKLIKEVYILPEGKRNHTVEAIKSLLRAIRS